MWHFLERCCGPEIRRAHIGPHPVPAVKGLYPDQAQQILDEAHFGVTVVTYRCRKCGKEYENRYLGRLDDDDDV